jgi:hypothetical protein
LLLAALSTPALGQQQPSEEDLVKQTQNPVADLISVPLQNNFNFGTGSKNRTVYGSGKFSMGPAAVALTMKGHWVFGALANNQWSVAGWVRTT